MATGSTRHRISRRLRLGFCDSPHDGVIARERGRPARILRACANIKKHYIA